MSAVVMATYSNICDDRHSDIARTCKIAGASHTASILVLIGGIIGVIFGMFQFFRVQSIKIPQTEEESKDLRANANTGDEHTALVAKVAYGGKKEHTNFEVEQTHFLELQKIYDAVREGAESFLKAQYTLCTGFTIAFSIVVLILTSSVTDDDGKHKWDFVVGGLTATSFAVGAFTSILSGYMGMTVAVYSNARVTVEAVRSGADGWSGSFGTAFTAGSVMGFFLCGIALLMLFILINIFSKAGSDYGFGTDTKDAFSSKEQAKKLFECVAGYGLGGSSMALFGRVGGGIFTKAADVGADLSGKVAGVPTVAEDGTKTYDLLDEDSPLNPATIADNVGDNVGDVAGMGSDLFGSFAEASCAALVISAGSPEIVSAGYASFMFPLMVSAAGIVMCMFTSFLATHVMTVANHPDVEKVLKVQLFVSALLMTAVTYPLAHMFLPDKFAFLDYTKITTDPKEQLKYEECTRIGAWVCVVCGLWGGCIIGFITEYYTSHSYSPVREVAQSCQSGAATNIIYGLALGYLSCIIPISLLAINVYVAFLLCGMYGVALAALGMLGTLATCLSIDVYGPIADNAGGLAEMAEFPDFVRDKTDALDAAGNTTAAIGKGFAIGSAALVSLALFGGFVSRVASHSPKTVALDINVLRPITFAFLFLGAMLPYWFTAFCMKSVGMAANEMVMNVSDQFERKTARDADKDDGFKDTNLKAAVAEYKRLFPDDNSAEISHGRMIKEKIMKPNYQECIDISTKASLWEMIAPGCLVMFAPLITGIFFGVEAVCGLLVGSLVSAVQLAISQSNSGGAWDNAKKFVEGGSVSDKQGAPQGKGTDLHKASVVGDTVGDPLKDTSGPALNIVMKLMAILSLVFSDFFVSINAGRGVFKIPTTLDLSK